MALVKPIVNDLTAFDATNAFTVTFTASGGDQVTGNTIKVVTNDVSETTVYQNTVISYNLSHVIPANTLTNGQYYKVAIMTQDVLGNTSPWSNFVPFYCFSTPTLSFNINEGQTLNTSSYNVRLTYDQEQNEKIDYAVIELYNNNDVLIDNSGNLYDSNYPPLTFSHTIFGLENHAQYYVIGRVLTVHGTTISTRVSFRTNYNTIEDENELVATLNSCEGYVNLLSNKIGNIKGISNPDPVIYINHEMADLRSTVADINIPEYAYWAKWDKVFTIPHDFLLRLWFYPARQPFEVIRLSNADETSYLKVNFRRDTTTDYLSIRTDNGTRKDLSLGTICNGNTKVFLWIKVVDDVWDVRCDVLSTTSTILDWNTNTDNIPYNVTSDLTYGGESYETFSPSTDRFFATSDRFTTVIIGNGVFDHLNVTRDVSLPYSTIIPLWDKEHDILSIKFNDNLISEGENYTRLVLKRKGDNNNWMNLQDIHIQGWNDEAQIDFNDAFIPTGITQEYAMVVYIDDIPSEYHTVEITPEWGKYFLSDKTHNFPLNYAVLYSNHTQNIQNGVFLPIGAKYPIITQNGEGNYKSGSLQFTVLGYQYEIDKRLDRISMTKERDDMLAFLTNGKAKCLTDFNGNIFIIKVINSPQISYDSRWGNNIPTISFDWVEQGEYNNYDDMLDLGFFDYIVTE